MTELEFFLTEAKKINEAKIEGKKRHAAIVEYQSTTGKTYRFYWNGARYEDRPSKTYAECKGYKFTGIYKAR